MAFSDLLGTQLVLSRDYGMEELYELIRDQLFDAGRPRLEPGVSAHIVFPTQEDRGRVVIRGQNGQFYAQWCEGPVAPESGRDWLRCQELARKTGEQINSIHL